MRIGHSSDKDTSQNTPRSYVRSLVTSSYPNRPSLIDSTFAQPWAGEAICFLLAREENTLAVFTFFTSSPHLSSSSPALAATFSCSLALNSLQDGKQQQ
jgi:hypothetical protein